MRTFSDLETQRHLELLETDDCREGFVAYAERREPRFVGR